MSSRPRQMFSKVLIANRGVIACRIERTLAKMGIRSVALFSDPDAGSLHVSQADEAIYIGAGPASDSYLNVDAVIEAARSTGAEAIHPGYGFLSENASFAEACNNAGLKFIGPTPDNMRAFGLKHRAREIATAHGIPLAPGTGLLADSGMAMAAAEEIGFPVILKATAGGGGIGMRVCETAGSVMEAFAAVQRLAGGAFSDGGVFLERYVARARHVEVQVFGDGQGLVVALGERDCSLQRRNQKVIEETPAPHLPARVRTSLLNAAVRLTGAVNYRSAGTVEFLYDPEREDFFFLEVNTRLQVEHGVTEEVTGIDLVEWMIRGATGDYDFLRTWSGPSSGAAIQARLYAEDPGQDFRPSAGRLTDVRFAKDARIETWVESGAEISPYYDPLLAKLIVTAPDRASAVAALQRTLDETQISGVETNLAWLREVARSPAFVTGEVSTRALADVVFRPATIRVLSGGPETTIQDYPGRVGYWDVGVPPSGPMDALAFRLGNRILGNAEGAAGLEVTALGATLLFNTATEVCLTGADFGADVDGRPIGLYEPVAVEAGETLKLGRVRGPGLRGYVLVQDGIDVPDYLGAKSCFTLGQFGGHAGRALAAGDVLHLNQKTVAARPRPAVLDSDLRPALTHSWTVRVLTGPHGAPDFFTPADIDMIAATEWRVHYNSNRTGVRLIGPKPTWARPDGGEAGLHPSNIHDNAYAIGAVDFTGDMPILLGPDGPSLGGFVCPFVTIQADLWKLGQLAPGDVVSFEIVSDDHALAAERAQDEAITALVARPKSTPAPHKSEPSSDAVLGVIEAQGVRPRVTYRRQGDRRLLVEYGPIVLDLELRLRVHALMLELQRLDLSGVVEITPGIRSLQVHFDSRRLSQSTLLTTLAEAEERLGGLDAFEIPSRTVHLPLSWKDPAIYQTIEKYMASVRDDAPWCPDNIEFIQRINGLSSIEDVRRIVFEASYLVLGLGDVYLGAPVATPIDPRHRLVTTKYNPARTWTPPNVVGIGGAYLCIYGMEGPGGYQLFGRTLQVWNTYKSTNAFVSGRPWLLRFFDQIRFFPVSHEELTQYRRDFPLGRYAIKTEEQTFRLADYRKLLSDNQRSIAAFQAQREAAFSAEREDWRRRGEFARVEALADTGPLIEESALDIPEGADLVEAPLGGSVWKVLVTLGARVKKGDVVAVIEAMKTECDVASPFAGVVTRIYAEERRPIAPGAPIVALETV